MTLFVKLAAVLLTTHMSIGIFTDGFYGERDPLGPYPRIPDREKLKVTFAIIATCIYYARHSRLTFSMPSHLDITVNFVTSQSLRSRLRLADVGESSLSVA